MYSREDARNPMESPTINWKKTVQMALTSVALVLPGAGGIQSKQQEPPSLTGDHAHSVIAITCPCTPFFEIGEQEDTELRMIKAAFELMGQHAQYVYVHYEDAVGHMQKHHVQGILAFANIHKPGNSVHLSEPLVTRDFVTITLAENQQTIGKREDLAKLRVGIHPDILDVLEPQLMEELDEPESLQQISNHVLLASMLLTGAIDALVTEKSIFTLSLSSVPNDARPSQRVKFYQVFDPVSPVILFEDRVLRDRFDDAWKEIVKIEAGRK